MEIGQAGETSTISPFKCATYFKNVKSDFLITLRTLYMLKKHAWYQLRICFSVFIWVLRFAWRLAASLKIYFIFFHPVQFFWNCYHLYSWIWKWNCCKTYNGHHQIYFIWGRWNRNEIHNYFWNNFFLWVLLVFSKCLFINAIILSDSQYSYKWYK